MPLQPGRSHFLPLNYTLVKCLDETPIMCTSLVYHSSIKLNINSVSLTQCNLYFSYLFIGLASQHLHRHMTTYMYFPHIVI